jgi:DNA (cytosine-5)-methyltransferase 1
MDAIEKDNPSLKDVLPKVFARGNLDPTNLGGLIDLIGNISLGDAKEIIAQDFASINGSSYYVVPVKVLKAVEFGIPQTRERVIFIGINKDAMKSDVRKYLDKHGELPKHLNPYPAQTHGTPELDGIKTNPTATTKAAFAGLKEPELSSDLSQQSFSKAKYFGKKVQGQTEVSLSAPGPTIRAEHHGNIEFRRLSEENGGKNVAELKNGINNFMDKYNNRRFHSSIGYQKPMNVYRGYLANAA